MPRDYSQRSDRNKNGKHKPAASSGQRPGLPGPVWMVIGLTLGLLIAAYIYIAKPSIEIPDELDLVQVKETAGARDKAKADAESKSEPSLPPEPESRFAFYEMLPNYEIVVPREQPKTDEKPDEPPPKLDQPGKYVIQAGSFRSYQDADRRKASIALLGIVSRIEKATIGANGDTWYRVMIGPEGDLNKVNGMLGKLKANEIDSLLIRVKG